MKKKFFFDRKEKKLQMDSEENSFERCVLCGVVTDVPVQMPVSERKCYIGLPIWIRSLSVFFIPSSAISFSS